MKFATEFRDDGAGRVLDENLSLQDIHADSIRLPLPDNVTGMSAHSRPLPLLDLSHARQSAPRLIRHLDDRDLLHVTHIFSATNFQSHPATFGIPRRVVDHIQNFDGQSTLVRGLHGFFA